MRSVKRKIARQRHNTKAAKVASQRSRGLQKAGLELLAHSDFENVSMAQIAKNARCSVGSIYYRYKDKNAYLCQLIGATFRDLENGLGDRLETSSVGRMPRTITLSEFLTHLISRLSTPENAGIIRAALKLGATEPEALRPYEDYRESVFTTAQNIFKGTSNKKIRAREFREALQIVFAAITDAALMPKNATMKLGSDDMLNTLCAMVANNIGVRLDFRGKITKTTVIAGNEPEEAPAIDKKEAPNKKKPTPRRCGKVTVL